MFIVWRENHAPQVGSFDSVMWIQSELHSIWNCLAPRRSLSMKFSPLIFLFPIVPYASSTVTRVLLAFRPHLCAKNEAPEEEEDSGTGTKLFWNESHSGMSHQKGVKKACRVDCRSKRFLLQSSQCL